MFNTHTCPYLIPYLIPYLMHAQVTDVSMFNTVYLTGGTDGTENFGDLWLLKGAA